MINSESFGFLYMYNVGRPQGAAPTKNIDVGVDPRVDPSRFNFIVSTKISKKATDRNLIRRRLSEIVRDMFFGSERFKTVHYNVGNISGVFLAKKSILGKKYQELRDEVAGLLNKIC